MTSRSKEPRDDALAWVLFAACSLFGVGLPAVLFRWLVSFATTPTGTEFSTLPAGLAVLSFVFAFVPAGAAAGVAYAPFKGREHPPNSTLSGAVGVAMGLSVIGWYAVFVYLLVGGNQRLDRSLPRHVVGTLDEVIDVRGAKGGRWQEWRITGGFGAVGELRFVRPEALDLAPGSAVEVTYHPGLFGFPWGVVAPLGVASPDAGRADEAEAVRPQPESNGRPSP